MSLTLLQRLLNRARTLTESRPAILTSITARSTFLHFVVGPTLHGQLAFSRVRRPLARKTESQFSHKYSRKISCACAIRRENERMKCISIQIFAAGENLGSFALDPLTQARLMADAKATPRLTLVGYVRELIRSGTSRDDYNGNLTVADESAVLAQINAQL